MQMEEARYPSFIKTGLEIKEKHVTLRSIVENINENVSDDDLFVVYEHILVGYNLDFFVVGHNCIRKIERNTPLITAVRKITRIDFEELNIKKVVSYKEESDYVCKHIRGFRERYSHDDVYDELYKEMSSGNVLRFMYFKDTMANTFIWSDPLMVADDWDFYYFITTGIAKDEHYIFTNDPPYYGLICHDTKNNKKYAFKGDDNFIGTIDYEYIKKPKGLFDWLFD